MAPMGGGTVGTAAAGFAGFGNAYPAGSPSNGVYPATGNGFDFTQGAPFAQPGMPAPYQAQQPVPYQQQQHQYPPFQQQQQPQQQQPVYPSSGAGAQAYPAPAQNCGVLPFNFTGASAPPGMGTAPAAAPYSYPPQQQQQQQQQQQPFAWGQPTPTPPSAQSPSMYGSNPQAAGPYSSGAPPQSSFDFTSGAPFAPANAPAPQSHTTNLMSHGGAGGPAVAWGAPPPAPPANFSASPNRSRITVLSVSKPPGDGAPNAAPQWP